MRGVMVGTVGGRGKRNEKWLYLLGEVGTCKSFTFTLKRKRYAVGVCISIKAWLNYLAKTQNALLKLLLFIHYSCWLLYRINTSYSLFEEESAHYTQTNYLGIHRVQTFVLIRNTLCI